MAVCLALEYLPAAAPAGHKWKLSYARTWKLQVSLGETEHRAMDSHNINFLMLEKADLALRGTVGHYGKHVTSSML